MKYTAIATIVLLLLPLAFVPMALSNQPGWFVELRVRPTHSEFTGPCVVSTDFTKDVYLWNDKTMTGFGVYAYDFYLYWDNTADFSLKGFVNHIPWPSGSYFLVINETGTVGGWDFYHVAVTAVGNATLNPALELGATGVFNASLVTLTFHIDDEPCWPEIFHTHFLIGNALGALDLPDWNSPPEALTYAPILSTGCGVRIDMLEIANGDYTLTSSQPNIDPLYNGGYYFAEDAIGESYTITVALSNITKAYGYEFTLTWDPLWYNASIQHVTILPSFAPPYEILTMQMGTGTLYVKLLRPCEKPTIHAAGYTPVVEVTFITTNTPMVGQIPVATNTTFVIQSAVLYVKCDGVTTYTPQTGLLVSGPVIQAFIPKSRADITIDGVVDIEDLAALAEEYGNVHPWASLAGVDLVTVDIFDLVYVAKRYGDP